MANIAENVKEAKEGLRQKVLFVGMDNVHQELLDKPTTLPLGPELVVTGINVRYCSYFNSNTLPLKISFIGPDREFLPAIFKVFKKLWNYTVSHLRLISCFLVWR